MFESLKNQLEQLITPAETNNASATPGPSMKERSRAFFQSASEKLAACQKAASERTNQLAEKVAETITDWTGRETTSNDVKTAAVIGATVGVVMAAGPMASRAIPRTSPAAGLGEDAGHGISPHVPHDPTQQWEQDDLEYDQLQYDNLRDHNEYMDRMDDVASDQISYNESFDMGGFDY